VRAAAEDRSLDGAEDAALLELATTEGRIMVTFNVRDFARIAAEWAAGGRPHAGCLMLVGIDHSEFGLTLRVIDAALEARCDQEAWVDFSAWGSRATGRAI
jgi:hypothetical protein